MADHLRCPRCGSTNAECQPKPHLHRCLDCGYTGEPDLVDALMESFENAKAARVSEAEG